MGAAIARGIEIPEAVLAMVEPLISSKNFETYLLHMFSFNLKDQLERFHLNPVDKYAMATGLEMRVPYLDDEVVQMVRGLPLDLLVRRDLGIRKYVLRTLCLQRYGIKYADIVMREKLGVPSSGVRMLRLFNNLCETTLPSTYRERHHMGRYFDSKLALFLLIFL